MTEPLKTSIKNTLQEYGYHLEMLPMIQEDNKEFYRIKLYLDSGQSFGTYKIPKCDTCFEDEDIILYIREQFKLLHPELF